jgi:hypothetical protein
MAGAEWEGGNGNGSTHYCEDPLARRSAAHALKEAQRVGTGLIEAHGLIVGVENRLTDKLIIGFELLGIGDIRQRFQEMDAARRRGTPPLPPPRQKTASELELERAANRINEIADKVERISSHDNLVEERHSDPVESAKKAAKKVTFGFLYIGWDAAGEFVKDHWKELLLAALATGHLPWLLQLLGKLPPFVQHLLHG